MVTLRKGDCLEIMGEIEAESVDFILVDPPFGTIKGSHLESGSSGHAPTGWDTCLPFGEFWENIERVLRPNGGAAIFGQGAFTCDLIKSAPAKVPFSYRCIWKKKNGGNHLGARKAPINYYEDIALFFKEWKRYDYEGESPTRDYARRVLEYIGRPKAQIIKEMGHGRADHFFRWSSTQFGLCTLPTYLELIERYNIDKMKGFRPYHLLSKEWADFKEESQKKQLERFPRVFNLPEGARSVSNIWEFEAERRGRHPTEKPVALLRHILELYTRPGDLILDFTMGGGSTGVACIETGRRFIGIEIEPYFFEMAKERINEALEVANKGGAVRTIRKSRKAGRLKDTTRKPRELLPIWKQFRKKEKAGSFL